MAYRQAGSGAACAYDDADRRWARFNDLMAQERPGQAAAPTKPTAAAQKPTAQMPAARAGAGAPPAAPRRGVLGYLLRMAFGGAVALVLAAVAAIYVA